jgi:L-ribulose-5-phosphate 4-epimerase
MGSYENLKLNAWDANMQLQQDGLVIQTFGNVSAYDPDLGAFAIKPSGVPYRDLKPSDMVVLDLDCRVLEGALRPSSDTRTHAELFRAIPGIRGVAHTHSTHAVAWAQAQRCIPILGTTHADQYAGPIPVTPLLADTAIEGDYEEETGKLILRTLETLPRPWPQMILVAGHGPFTWGATPQDAVAHSGVLEEIARMALLTLQLQPGAPSLKETLIRKHFQRKHGHNAYYGQN